MGVKKKSSSNAAVTLRALFLLLLLPVLIVCMFGTVFNMAGRGSAQWFWIFFPGLIGTGYAIIRAMRSMNSHIDYSAPGVAEKISAWQKRDADRREEMSTLQQERAKAAASQINMAEQAYKAGHISATQARARGVVIPAGVRDGQD